MNKDIDLMIKKKNFPLTVNLKRDELLLTVDDLLIKYKDLALEEAVADTLWDMNL